MSPRTLPVTAIQRFCMHDGPGIRTTVFLKGCPLRCRWCHNPETQSASTGIFFDDTKCIGCMACSVCPEGAQRNESGFRTFDRSACVRCGKCADVCPTGALKKDNRDMTVDEITDAVLRDAAFYGKTGGITVSGGEPTVHPEGLIELLEKCKSLGMTTAIETCGFFDPKWIPNLCRVTDLFLWDFKDSDEERHLANTGVSGRRIVENLREVDRLGGKTVLRCILLKGINTDEAHFRAIRALRDSLSGCRGAELLPYHPRGESKGRMLGAETSFHNRKYIPDAEDLQRAERILSGAE